MPSFISWFFDRYSDAIEAISTPTTLPYVLLALAVVACLLVYLAVKAIKNKKYATFALLAGFVFIFILMPVIAFVLKVAHIVKDGK